MEQSTLQFFLFVVFSAALVWALVSHYGRDLWGLLGSIHGVGGGPGEGRARHPLVERNSALDEPPPKRPPRHVAPTPAVVVVPVTAPDMVADTAPRRAGLSRAEILRTIEAVGGAVERLRPVLGRIQSKRDHAQAVMVDDISASALDDLAILKVGCGKLGNGADADRFTLLSDDVAQFHSALLRLVGLARSGPLEGSWTDPVAATLEELLARVSVAMGGIATRMRAEAGFGKEIAL